MTFVTQVGAYHTFMLLFSSCMQPSLILLLLQKYRPKYYLKYFCYKTTMFLLWQMSHINIRKVYHQNG